MAFEEELWYPLQQAADILKQDYGIIARASEEAGVVRIDPGTLKPCVPGTFLKRYPEFLTFIQSQKQMSHSVARQIPLLQVHADIFALRQIKKHGPFFADFQGGPARDTQIDQMLLHGNWRFRRSGATTYYRLKDFAFPESWASSAEVSWSLGILYVQEAIQEKKKRAQEAPLYVKGEDQLSTPEEQLDAPEVFPWTHQPLPGAPLKMAADAFKIAATGEADMVKFKFFQRVQQPTQEQKEFYIDWVPLALLDAAKRHMIEWRDCLQEDRLGAERSFGLTSEADFRAHFLKTEQAIYREKRAWAHGYLLPLLPPGFSLLF